MKIILTFAVVFVLSMALVFAKIDDGCKQSFEYITAVDQCLTYDADKCQIGPTELAAHARAQNYVREHCQMPRATEWTGQRGIPTR